MLLALPFIALGLIQQAAAAPDRSGETALRRLFERGGKVKTLHALIRMSSTDSVKTPLYPAGEIDLYYEAPKKLRLSYSKYWGGVALIVADGSTVMVDGMDDSSPIVLQDEGKSALEATNDLLENGSYSSPIIYLWKGPAAFDKLVSKTGKITDERLADGREEVRFDSPIFGDVKLFIPAVKGPGLPTLVEYDNLPFYKKQYDSAPEFNDPPGQALTRDEIEYLQIDRRLPRGIFEPAPPKGKAVRDDRKKKGAFADLFSRSK